jgi:hypothetical protein
MLHALTLSNKSQRGNKEAKKPKQPKKPPPLPAGRPPGDAGPG